MELVANSLEQWHNDPGVSRIEYTRMAWSGAMFASNAFDQVDLQEQPNIISRNLVETGESMLNAEFPLLGANTCP